MSFLDNVVGLSPFFDTLSIANAYKQTKQKTFSENAWKSLFRILKGIIYYPDLNYAILIKSKKEGS